MPRVTSADNPRLHEAMRLIASSRDRRKSGRCVLEGEHLAQVYSRRLGAPETLVVAEGGLGRPGVQALMAATPPSHTLVVPDSLWRELAQVPEGVRVLAVVPVPQASPKAPGRFCLLLDDVQDPGNVGSMLRSAAAAGVEQVWMSPACAFAWSPKVLRAAQGAHFHLSVHEGTDLANWVRAYDGTVAASVAAGGLPVFQADLRGRVALIVGNEGAGIAPALGGLASLQVTVPMPGGFESLNAAAAAAICLFECVRQRALRKAPARGEKSRGNLAQKPSGKI